MSRLSLLLIGAGGHAEACIDVIEQDGRFEIVGMIGTRAEAGMERFGYRVIAADEELASVAREHRHALIVVGQVKSPEMRMKLFAEARALGLELPAIVSPRAYVARTAKVGAGSIVMHGAIVNAGSHIGENCIVNSGALIEHGATVGDHCHISTGAILNGAVRVGAGTFLGSGCTVKQGLVLGARCVVGMASCVRHDQPDGARVVGG